MCGICGFNWEDKLFLQSMISSIRHRGPDHTALFFDNNLSIGYNRLSIIDIKSGNQPLYNEDQSILVFFNGEIYNFKEIKKELEKKGHIFSTETDTEVIVHSYEEYGIECLQKFNGMFAFVIYDIDKKEVFIARDRLGIKPLYYFFKDELFIFSSEMKSILNYKEIKKEIDKDVLNIYFTLRYCAGEKTIIKDIKKLLPGHYLVYKNKKILIKKYWDLDFKTDNNKNLEYYKKKYLDLFEKSVKYRMISDVPVGALLSGGIDSSSIVAMMRKNSDEEINTYTIGFDEGFKNEFDDAKIISEKFNTKHHELSIGADSIKYLDKILWHLDEPLADPTVIPNYILSKKASKKVKVLLNGDGADEIFGGYEWYKYMKIWKNYYRIPSPLKKINSNLMSFYKEPFFLKLKEFLDGDFPSSYTSLISVFGESEKKDLLNRKSNKKDVTLNIIKKNFQKPKDFLNKMLYSDIKTYLTSNMLMKFDKITMANSIEGRVPFCDHRLVEFSAILPQKYKLHGFNEKYILRQSMKNILPKKTIKKKKQRFLVPTDIWSKKEFGEYSKKLVEENKELTNEFFNKEYINKIMNSKTLLSNKLLKFNSLTKLYYSRQLWSITIFISWYNKFIE